MPIGAQPSGRRGTVGHPYSALNLRLAFAIVGLVFSAVLGAVLLRVGAVLLGWLCVALALVAAVDIVVIQLRRRARARSEPGVRHSLFE